MKNTDKKQTKSFIHRLKDSLKKHKPIKKEIHETHNSLKSVIPNYPIFI